MYEASCAKEGGKRSSSLKEGMMMLSAGWGSISLRWRHGSRVFLPSSCFQYLFDLRQSKVAFFDLVVEMRRNTNSRLRAIVHKNVSCEKLAANFSCVWTIHGNSPGAFGGILWSIYAPTSRFRAFHQSRGHFHGFLPNCIHPDLIQNVESRLAGIKRRNVRCPVQITK